MFDSVIKTYTGKEILSYSDIEFMREEDRKKANPLCIFAQRGCQEKFLSTSANITIFGGSRGSSKGEPYHAKVCTPFGFRQMGDLKVGDIISDTEGNMQEIIYITELGNKEVYRLKFSDGSSVECTTDHLWNIRRTNKITKKRKLNGGDISLDWRTWTFDMIKDFLDKDSKQQRGPWKQNLLIPLPKPVKFTKAIHWHRPTIDPYVVGALIGDGCMSDVVTSNGEIRFTTMDNEIVAQFENAGISMDNWRSRAGSKAKDYRIKNATLYNELYELGLVGCISNSKFVPEYYKTATIEERLALVQGMMDTDGTISTDGKLSYTTVSEELAKDFKYMIESLGGTGTIMKKKAGYKDKDGKYVRCQDVYGIYIRIDENLPLFRLSRKLNRRKPYNDGVSVPHRRIVGYEFVGYDKCRCIAVSNPNSLYMTDDFIVTHNSFSLLMETLKDIYHPNFNALILRNERDDLLSLVKDAYILYGQLGTYNKSVSDMTWNFYKGGSLKFSYYADSYEDFIKRFQGKQYAYIAIDEITHAPYDKFKYLVTCNRNAFGIRNRFYGTCNPDPDSWVRKFIDWWIGDDGFPISERSGKLRYCFMDGDRVESIFWGDTREEVYAQCKGIIDKLWKPAYEELGFNKLDMFIKSVTFIKGSVEENIKLITSDPNYVANLAQQSEEQRARDLEGNWNYKTSGDDLIKMQHLEDMYKNPQQIGDGIRRASCDVAFTGGDSLVMWLWIGNHVADIFVCRNDSKTAINAVKAKLGDWGVREENLTYDLQGIGQSFKGFFPNAMPFNNEEAVDEKYKGVYKNIKSQCAYMLCEKLWNKEISIEPRILDLKFSGRGFENMPLRQILMKERKCIRANEQAADKGFAIIKKDMMKKFVGHSPDYFESLFMRFIFDVKKTKHTVTKPKGLWRL